MTIEYYAPSAPANGLSSSSSSYEGKIVKVDDYVETLFGEANCYLAERLLTDIYSRHESSVDKNTSFLSNSLHLTNITWIKHGGSPFVSFGELYATMNILIDARTRLLVLDLSQLEGSLFTLPMFMTRLGATLGMIYPPIGVDELERTILTAGVESLLIVVAGAQHLSTACFMRTDQLLGAICRGTGCRVHWFMDDISMLGRLPLTTQANIVLTRVEGRPIDDILLDILGGFLLHAQLLPSEGFLDEIRIRLEQRASSAEIRLFLKLSLLEHFIGRPRESDGFLKLASVRQELEAIPDPNDATIREIGKALETDAGTAIEKVAWAWTVLTTVRSLWGEEACPAADLLRRSNQLSLLLPHWSTRILSASKMSMSDETNGVRQMQLFQRALATRADDNPTTKELLALLPAAELETFLRTIGDFISSHLNINAETLLEDFCQLIPGRVVAKLTTPRPIEVLQMALEHPEFYQQGRVHNEPPKESGPPSDTSIVFRLAGECGKFINTHDWYVSYRQLADPQRTQDEPSLLLRFMRSVSELCLLGFVAPTKKRKEHYERLVVFRRALG